MFDVICLILEMVATAYSLFWYASKSLLTTCFVSLLDMVDGFPDSTSLAPYTNRHQKCIPWTLGAKMQTAFNLML